MSREKRLNNFIADTNLSSLKSWEQTTNVFDLIALSETRVSAFLAWLFNPKESHALLDMFLKRLLIEAMGASSQSNSSLNSVFEIETACFSEALVYTEFPTLNGQEKIDIVIIDEANGLCIFIENKYGSTPHDNQLNKYYEALSNTYKDYETIFIYLDCKDKAITEQEWIQLNYDWIYIFLEQVVRNRMVNGPAFNIIQDFYCHSSDDYSLDPIYTNSDSILTNLYNEHNNFINDIRSYEYSSGKYVTEITYTDILDEEYTSYGYILYKTYKTHEKVISTLLTMSEWTNLSDQISHDIRDSNLIEQRSTGIFFTTPQAVQINEESNIDDWPFCVCCITTHNKSKEHAEYEIYLKIHKSYSYLFSKEIEEEISDNRKRDWFRIKRFQFKELNASYPLKLYKLLEERLLLNGM
ncbi:hypothetical protein D0S45_19445 [Marinifilum sp. JC120]|nr:hypothetical protein D0S45_19445 [Marinifilum sp. JC120]